VSNQRQLLTPVSTIVRLLTDQKPSSVKWLKRTTATAFKTISYNTPKILLTGYPANYRPTTNMELNHKKHLINYSPSLHNNEPAQILRVPTNPKDLHRTLHPVLQASTPKQHSPHPLTHEVNFGATASPHVRISTRPKLTTKMVGSKSGVQNRKRLLNTHPPTQPPVTDTRNRLKCLGKTAPIKQPRKNLTHLTTLNLHQYFYMES